MYQLKISKKCRESVINQAYQNIEVILIYDGSIDNSSFIYKGHVKKDNRSKINRKKNLSISTVK